jgi:hypothetical protein
MNLYQITTEFNALEEMLLLDGGEISPDYELLEKEIENLLISKTDNFVSFVQKLEDEIELSQKHIKRIQEFKKVRETAIETLRKYATSCMDKIGKPKIGGTFGEISICKPVQVLLIESEDKVPVQFTRVKVEVDKTKIKEALKNGEQIEGCSLVDGKRLASFKMKSIKG